MFKAVKRTEGVSTTDIVGRMLTCGMEHFVDDEEMRGKRASDVSADDAVLANEAVGSVGVVNAGVVLVW